MLMYILHKYNKFADLYFISGQKPRIKIEGIIQDIEFRDNEIITTNNLIVKRILKHTNVEDNPKLNELVKTENTFGEMDFSIQVGVYRFRINLFQTSLGLSAVLRLIPEHIPDFLELGLPTDLLNLTKERLGLVLVTGITGSGKSTTLAALINEINNNQSKHILTIEDPIEFKYKPNKSIISQREIGSNTKDFAGALRRALREAPDVILVGEMRDKETIEITLKAAETGHLVFSTLHTYSAVQTIERILSNFDGNDKKLVQNSLATVLTCIISQKLIRTNQNKLEIAYEILYNNFAVSNNIRSNNIQQIPNTAKSGDYKDKNVFLNEVLTNMVKKTKISREDAFNYSYDKEDLRKTI